MKNIIGRDSILKQIDNLHDRNQHISIVGARSMGKTTLLQQVVRKHVAGSALFMGAGIVDLRHNPPTSTHAVLRRMGEVLRDIFTTTTAGALSFLANEFNPDSPEEELYDQLKLTLDLVDEAGKRILIVLDGCDTVLQNPSIPVDLWNSIRALAQRNSLRLMTGTRDRLVQLCYNPEARDSPFFNIFYTTPLQVGPFAEPDWEDMSSKYRENFESPAVREIVNWTGGHPALVSLLLDRVSEYALEKVKKENVDQAALSLISGQSMVLETLWRDGGDENRGDIVQLARGSLLVSDLPPDRLKFLLARGIALQSGNKVKLANRFVEHLATARQLDVSSVRQLFEKPTDYESNIRPLLELRLGQIGGDPTLRRLVKRAVQDVASDPAGCLGNARDVVERTLSIIWNFEAPDGYIPEAWIQEWKSKGISSLIDRIPANRKLPAPDRRGEHCAILRVATGTDKIQQQTQGLSKPTFLIIDFIAGLGNARNHQNNSRLSVGLSVSFCFACIELISALNHELT
ncbi:ATP-binding protein [Corallococcus sp. bb12-1]|uniref:AAA family ATPase n=1 Tax=Corallococcus sp. bb12-1 TaxID=2996784 RepID=UPI00226EC9DD|nr:ATP-binding protein [Corallococcus sp. bb12-1]MCY1043853.1 ATP-binding protein [Corallococcus sp. bb12-1]